MAELDYAAEGFLEGLDPSQREARVELIDRLLAAGVELEEVRAAIGQGRLALLPVEHALMGEERYSTREVAEMAGVDLDVLDSQWRALGMVVDDPDARTRSERDVEGARRLKGLLDAGLPPDGIVEAARAMSVAMAQIAAANRQVVGELFARESAAQETVGMTELELAERLEGLARNLVPTIGPTLEYVYRLQLREQLRHAALDTAALAAGETTAGEELAVAFADLVGFTRLGERLPAEEFGAISSRFGELAAAAASGPIRLVKLIGDGAMLASPDPGALIEGALDLVDLVDAEEGMPEVRAGVGLGEVVNRGGDLYGATVNVASRITDVARPGSVLVTAAVRDSLDGRFRFSNAGTKKLKGLGAPIRIFRCRRLEQEAAGEQPPREDPPSGRRGSASRRR